MNRRHLLCSPGPRGPELVTLDEDGDPAPVAATVEPSNLRRTAQALGELWAPAPATSEEAEALS